MNNRLQMSRLQFPLGMGIVFVFILLLSVSQSSCTTISYYNQSISGHLQIIHKRQDINKLLASPDLPTSLRDNLDYVLTVRKFAKHSLLLPVKDTYESYVDIGRPYVAWNVIATPEFSLQPVQSCFLIIGCLSYRGYFSKERALTFAESLKSKNYDVHVAGVTAYSTLGWFDDPILSTMLHSDKIRLTMTIFHELAHQKIYIKNDTQFNEAFADSVALIGIQRLLYAEHSIGNLQRFVQWQKSENEFLKLVRDYKTELESLYESNVPVPIKRSRKSAIFKTMQRDYKALSSDWDRNSYYAAWFESGLNNAKLAIALTYKDLVDGFLKLLAEEKYDLKQFYTRVSQLGQCSESQRKQLLSSDTPVTGCPP